MISDKHNWAKQRPPGLAYRITNGQILYEAEPLLMTPDDLFAQETTKPIDIACAWLLAKLSAGPQPSIDIQAAAALENIADRTLQRAKERLGIEPYQADKRWMWQLPAGQIASF